MTGNLEHEDTRRWPRQTAQSPSPDSVSELISLAIQGLDRPVTYQATLLSKAEKLSRALLDNAYRHALGLDPKEMDFDQPPVPGVRFEVGVVQNRRERWLLIEVYDPEENVNLNWQAGSRGFWTVRQFADRSHAELVEEGGKVVWAEIDMGL